MLLGLACTNPNPSDRPSMAEAVQVISKLVPRCRTCLLRGQRFVWPPKEWPSLDSDYCTSEESNLDGISASRVELELVTVLDQPPQEIQSTTFFSV